MKSLVSPLSIASAKSCRRSAETNKVSESVGLQLRALRKTRRMSIRALAERSGLSVNTLSLIENGKTSPSVATLHQLAQSLNVPIAAFFEGEERQKRVVYQKAVERRRIVFEQGRMESISDSMPLTEGEPFISQLEIGANSGETPIVYGGREFIYCLEGEITYFIEGKEYRLSPGDSLIFDAHTPHSWKNTANAVSRALLTLCPEDSSEGLSEPRFIP